MAAEIYTLCNSVPLGLKQVLRPTRFEGLACVRFLSKPAVAFTWENPLLDRGHPGGNLRVGLVGLVRVVDLEDFADERGAGRLGRVG